MGFRLRAKATKIATSASQRERSANTADIRSAFVPECTEEVLSYQCSDEMTMIMAIQSTQIVIIMIIIIIIIIIKFFRSQYYHVPSRLNP